jgi:hypothetical protein
MIGNSTNKALDLRLVTRALEAKLKELATTFLLLSIYQGVTETEVLTSI